METTTALSESLGGEISAEALSKGGDKKRVLVAEDNDINRLVVGTLLNRVGYTVDSVQNGAEALAAIESGNYDLALMDIHMPVMTGPEAVKRIRAMQSGKARLPIVALTAHAMQGAREDYLAAGFDDYLSKPFTPAGLLSVVRRWTDSVEPPEVVPAPGPRFEEIIEKLRPEFRTRLATDVVAIERLRSSLADGPGDRSAEALKELLSIVHRLTGTAGSLGFAEISELGVEVTGCAALKGDAVAMEARIDRLLRACRYDALS